MNQQVGGRKLPDQIVENVTEQLLASTFKSLRRLYKETRLPYITC